MECLSCFWSNYHFCDGLNESNNRFKIKCFMIWRYLKGLALFFEGKLKIDLFNKQKK